MKTLFTTFLLLVAASVMAADGWDYQSGFGDTKWDNDANGAYNRTTVIVVNNGPQPGPRYQIILSVTRADGSPVCSTGYPYLDGLGVNKHSEPLQFQVNFPPGAGGGFPRNGNFLKLTHEKFNLSADVKPYGADPSGDHNLSNNLSMKTIDVVGVGKGKPSCRKLMGE